MTSVPGIAALFVPTALQVSLLLPKYYCDVYAGKRESFFYLR